jgi:hypothetical protein
MNKSQGWVLAGGLAAMIGGLLWAVQTAAIIVTTVEPPILLTGGRRSSRSLSLGYMPRWMLHARGWRSRD